MRQNRSKQCQRLLLNLFQRLLGLDFEDAQLLLTAHELQVIVRLQLSILPAKRHSCSFLTLQVRLQYLHCT